MIHALRILDRYLYAYFKSTRGTSGSYLHLIHSSCRKQRGMEEFPGRSEYSTCDVSHSTVEFVVVYSLEEQDVAKQEKFCQKSFVLAPVLLFLLFPSLLSVNRNRLQADAVGILVLFLQNWPST